MEDRLLALALQNGLLGRHELAVHHLPDALRALVVEQALRRLEGLCDSQIMVLANMAMCERRRQ